MGQGGPSNGDLVSLWAQIAVHYASEGRVIFGVINEPHDSKVDHASKVA